MVSGWQKTCSSNILLLLNNLSQKTFRRLSLTNNLPVTQKPRAVASNASYDMSTCGLKNNFTDCCKFPIQSKSLNLIITFLDYQIHLTIDNIPLFSPKALETWTTKTTNQSINQHELAMAPHIQSSGAPLHYLPSWWTDISTKLPQFQILISILYSEKIVYRERDKYNTFSYILAWYKKMEWSCGWYLAAILRLSSARINCPKVE